ncbi:MAG: hypothetical protein R3B90_11720 [Planctomycetaceae bacterium]
MLHPFPPTAARSPVVVKFLAKGHHYEHREIFLRQFAGRSGCWGNCRFEFDPAATEYDWLVVYDDLSPVGNERFSTRSERLACPAANTIFVTMEPSSIKSYGRSFLDQFGVVLTSQEPWAIPGRNAVYSQPALRWFYGASYENPRTWDEMVARPPLDKTGDLSTVCSNKRQSYTMHAARYDFTMALRSLLPELELYGRGLRPIEDKADALDPYRYHIVVENHVAPHHWTEKLADAFLGVTLPFYFGCPNLDDYFDAESFIAIDISDPQGAARIIRDAIAGNEYERRLPKILAARRQVLEEYNLFAVLTRLIEQRHDPRLRPELGAMIHSRHVCRSRTLWTGLQFAIEQYRVKSRSRREQRRHRRRDVA